MNRTRLTVATVLVVVTVRLWAEPGFLAQSDHLSYLGEHAKSIRLLESKLPEADSPAQKAAIYWRLSRDTFDVANGRTSEGVAAKKELTLFERSERYADQAIALDPNNAKGYYWKAACVGRISQIRNLLRAFIEAGTVRELLFKAARLAPGDGEIWYVLAQLYSQIPGWPISFGNTAYAVSLGRKGLAAREAQVAAGSEPNVPEDYRIQLALELDRRGWSEAEREDRKPSEAREYRRDANPITKNFYYEGIAPIPRLSDRAEAIEIMKGVVRRLTALPRRTQTQDQALTKAERYLAKWTR